MAEIIQPENIKAGEVNLEDLLNSRRAQEQALQNNLNDIRFRPLAFRAESHQKKIDKQTMKAASLTDKINKGSQKINKWTAKIENAKGTKVYCEQLLATHALPKPVQLFFQEIIKKQEKKIERCQGKIDIKKQKIEIYKDKRNKCHKRISKQQAKIDKLAGIDRFITNMASSEGRKENFVQALTDMRKSSLDRKNKKAITVENKIVQRELALSKASTELEKIKLLHQLDKLTAQKDTLDGKIEQLERMTEKLDAFAAMSEEDTEKIISDTTERVKAVFRQDEYVNMDDVVIDEAEKAIDEQQQSHELTLEEQEQQSEKKTETQAEKEQESKQEPEKKAQSEQKQEQQTEHNPSQNPLQGGKQTNGADKKSELVRFSNLSGIHLQALKDAQIPLWVRQESDNTFSAFVQRPDAEQTKSVLSAFSQAQKKASSQVRHSPKPKI